jgi:hypothetical protein
MPVLDLDYVEDSGCDTDMNVVMTDAGHFIEVQGTAEGAAFDRAGMNRLLDLAQGGIADLIRLQKAALHRDLTCFTGAARPNALLASNNAGKLKEFNALLATDRFRARAGRVQRA